MRPILQVDMDVGYKNPLIVGVNWSAYFGKVCFDKVNIYNIRYSNLGKSI